MNSIISHMEIAGIVKPGQVYVLFNKGCDVVELESLYTIRTEDEIAYALYWDIEVVNRDCMSFIKFLGVEKFSEDRHEIRLLCRNDEEGAVVVISFLLYRIRTFKEETIRHGMIFGGLLG